MNKYPKVNYIGNKEKISKWICSHFPKNAQTVLDAFSGGCSLSYEAKLKGLEVYSNDILSINYHLANAIIQNNHIKLTDNDIDLIFEGDPYYGFMSKHYAEVYFFLDECKELDLYKNNIEKLDSHEKKSLAYSLIRRAMIRKMPYSRFTLNWDKIIQLRDEEYSYKKYKRRRAYHNKSIKHHFLQNLDDYNNAVFDNGKKNIAYNLDIFKLLKTVKADIIYLDPPYAGTMNNYHGFYGLVDNYISSKKINPHDNCFTNKKTIVELFEKLFSNLNNFKYWILSYNNSSYPSKSELIEILKKFSKDVKVVEKKHTYKITGKKNKKINKEYLFIIKNTNFL